MVKIGFVLLLVWTLAVQEVQLHQEQPATVADLTGEYVLDLLQQTDNLQKLAGSIDTLSYLNDAYGTKTALDDETRDELKSVVYRHSEGFPWDDTGTSLYWGRKTPYALKI